MRAHVCRVALFAAIFAGAGCGAEAQSADSVRVARGRDVYREQKCQACHSIGGVGSKRSPLDNAGRLTEEQLRKWITAPRDMNPKVRKPAYDKLPKDDLDALVGYLKTLRPSASNTTPPS
jgi:mono/diheme cytochrome c family protein